MAVARKAGRRFEPNIWPGFVDVMTALVMVIMFVLTILVVIQWVLRERLDTQQGQLVALGSEVQTLDKALDTAEAAKAELSSALDTARTDLDTRAAEIERLSAVLAVRESALGRTQARLTDREAEIAALMAARITDKAAADTRAAALTERAEGAEDRAGAAELAVASARREVDEAAARARLDAARADALEALVADLRKDGAAAATTLAAAQDRIEAAEAARLTDAAAAQALRARLDNAQTELTAMTLALEESRKRASDTLTLLAAAEAAKDEVQQTAERRLSEAEQQAALMRVAQDKLASQEALSAEGQRKVALLNAQVAQLSQQLRELQAVLDSTGAAKGEAEVRVSELGTQLNTALLRAAEAEKAKSALEGERAARAEAEAKDLGRYRSEFFGRLSQILEGRPGVKVVGDRFVFSSDVVFPAAGATLSPEGQAQIDSVTAQLIDIAADIPPEIDWIVRVDGHTDDTRLSGFGRYRDNWELSQARALAVVRYMVEDLGFPPDRVAAAGFGEYRPAVSGETPEARAQNRRIELKLTER